MIYDTEKQLYRMDLDEALAVCKLGGLERCCCFLGADVTFICERNTDKHKALKWRAMEKISSAQSLGGEINGHKGCAWDVKVNI